MAKGPWICNGPKDDPHDPYENDEALTECEICGRERPKGGGASRTGGRQLILAIPIAVAVVAIAGVALTSNTIPGLCNAIGNCQAWETQYESANQSGSTAQKQVEQAKSLAELEAARNSLNTAISQLQAIPENAKIKTQVSSSLGSYQESLKKLDARLETERTAQKAFDEAEKVAKQAEDKTANATEESLGEVVMLWRQAQELMGKVPTDTLAAAQTEAKLKEYRDKCQRKVDQFMDYSASLDEQPPPVIRELNIPVPQGPACIVVPQVQGSEVTQS